MLETIFEMNKNFNRCLNRPEYGPPECDKVELGTPVDMVLHVTLKVSFQ